ncbi:MAG: PAS domain S-box protein [Actinomycetota bacterium]
MSKKPLAVRKTKAGLPVHRARATSNMADARDVAATGRDDAAQDRDLAAGDEERQDAEDYRFAARDRTAAVRDRREAASRDRVASARDEAAKTRDAAPYGDREEAARHRVLAAEDRAAAALDRRKDASGATAALARDDAAQARDVASHRRHSADAAGDRVHAADDRAAAALDRTRSATDRRVATAHIRGAAQALAAIINSSQDAVIAKNVDGIITTWNDGATLVYGRSAAEMVGRSFEVMIPPDALTEERERHARIATGVAESGYHCMRLRGDGRSIEVIMSMSPIYDDAGVINGAASISRAASDSERDNARFAAVLEAAPYAVVCVDGQGAIILVNAQATKMFGYARHALLGADVEVLLPEGSRSRHVGLRSEFLLEPTTRPLGAGPSLSGRRRDGSAFPVDVSLAPVGSGAQAMVIAVVRDLTEERLLEQEAAENETRLRQLAESVDVVFLLLQLEPTAYLYVSPHCRDVLGLDLEELVNPLTAHPLDRAELELGFIPALVAGLPAESEHRILTPDGGFRWVRAVARPVPNPHGPPERTVVTVEDITRRMEAAEALKAAEAAARTANEAKNHFLSRMSHELRTPLNAVLGFGQLLEMQLADTEHAESVDHILHGGRHLLNLINDVLDIARIEAGETSISREPVLVTTVVGEALALMAPLAESAGVTLVASPGLGDCWVLADKQRLRQILLNLLSNAVKYNRAGGTVWVEHRAGEAEVAITVRDDGPGIDLELQGRLFTPFDRLGAEGTGVEGTGIGLALTRSLAELMYGSLGVDSAPGRGSAFTVTLPSTHDPAGDFSEGRVGRVAATVAKAPEGSFTLLYIEDNESNVRLMEHMLELRPAWRMINAGSGRMGIDLSGAHHPDLVLLDLHLPDISGAEVLRNLKARSETRALPVVIVTADVSAAHSRQLLATGAAACMTKPLDVVDVLALLDQTAAPARGPA